LLTVTLIVVELVFDALPVVAEPPLVLPLTLAEPVLADWLFVLVTLMQLLFSTFTEFFETNRTSFSELGPVVLIDPLLLPPDGMLQSPAPELVTRTDAFVEFAFDAAPLFALPPLVLPLTFAEPLVAP
jgi:hypothetical protein